MYMNIIFKMSKSQPNWIHVNFNVPCRLDGYGPRFLPEASTGPTIFRPYIRAPYAGLSAGSFLAHEFE